MFLRIYDAASGQTLRLPASQLVVYNNVGTPIMVAAEFGTDRSQRIAKAGDPEFKQVLASVGFQGKVVVDELILPEPQGTRIT